MDEILDLLGALMGGVYWLARGLFVLLEGLVALVDIAELFGGGKRREQSADPEAEREGGPPPA